MKLLGALALVAPSMAFAAPSLDSGNTAWMLTCTALVLFMTIPGLSLFYAGLVRSKNVLSVLMQCFALTCWMSILWVLVGYSIAFGDGGDYNGFWGGVENAFLSGIMGGMVEGKGLQDNGFPDTVFVAFQMTFAVITPALIVGGFAERMKFSAMMLFSTIWVLVVYAPVCHWVWGTGGWLTDIWFLDVGTDDKGDRIPAKVQDMAGGVVVHITAGVAALVCAVIIGSRRGFGTEPMPPHNLTMTVTGAGMLWVGWFGFNAGSAVAADKFAGMALLVTHISAAMGAFTWMLLERIRFGKPSVLGIVTGMVAGLGTITPASGSVGPMGAMVIGFCAGFVCFFATLFIKKTLKIDDSLDVFPVHGVGGILGTMLIAVFASSELGVFSGLGRDISLIDSLMVQGVGVVATIIYTVVATTVILLICKLVTGLRVDEEAERRGLDLSEHEERGYDI